MKLSILNTTLLSLFAFVILFSSCKKIPIQESFNVSDNDSLQYLDLKLKLDYKSPKDDAKAKIKIRMKKDSLIWASITATVGIEGLRCMITKDTVKIMDRMKKVYIVSDFRSISDKVNFKIDFDMLQSIILGNMPFKDYDVAKVKKEGRYLKIAQREREIDIENYINPATKRLEQLLMKDPKTQNSLQLQHKGFEASGNVALPKSTQIIINYLNKNSNKFEKTKIKIDQLKMQISDEALRFPFKVPEKYEKKILR